MTYLSIVSVNPTNEDWIKPYVAEVMTTVKKYGGKYLARTGSHQKMEEGGEDVALFAIVEWPSKEAATQWFESPEYKPLLEARRGGAKCSHHLVECKDDFGEF